MEKILKRLGVFNLDSKKYYEDKDGNFRVPVVIAKTGVLEYIYNDGDKNVKTREVKLPEHLLSKVAVFSSEGKPVTDGHPPDMVSPENYHKYVKGTFINPKVVKDEIHGEIVIYDQALKDDIKSGKKYQISPGFWSNTVFEKGEFNGSNYDAVQKDIMINHIAIVEAGRAGDSVSVKMDSADLEKMEEERKVEEYQQNKKPKDDEGIDPEDNDQGSNPNNPTEAAGDEGDITEDEIQELPERMQNFIKQLQGENQVMKKEMDKMKNNTDSAEMGLLLEARDFAMKFVTDEAISPSGDVDYYRRKVVMAAGHDTTNMDKAQLFGAFQIAKTILKKDTKVDDFTEDELSTHKSTMDKELEESEEINGSFVGKRK